MIRPKHIKRATFYECPVCGYSSGDRKVIQQHLQSHPIITEEVVYCNICGAGWYVNAYGERGAKERAEECYQKHQRAGNMDEVAMRSFFMSGGRFGYTIIDEGEKDKK